MAERKRDLRVTRARTLRRAVTDAERKLWQQLRRLPLHGSHFRRQATIGPYFADFACHDKRLVVEIDGGGHGLADQMTADDKRTEYLNSHGYRVVRFWNNEVMSNIEGVMTTIVAALNESSNVPPPLTPPHHAPRGGRGKS